MQNLKKLSISNLTLIILNDKNTSHLRSEAEIELKQRLTNIGWDYDEILHMDSRKIDKRGYDIDSYLIRPEPDMQQLMETYFTYCYDNSSKDNQLLFSEKHLCTDMEFRSSFFSKICDREIANLTVRIDSKKTHDSERETLLLFKKALEDRKSKIQEVKREKYYGINQLRFNELLQLLDRNMLLDLNCYMGEEQMYTLTSSCSKLTKYSISRMLEGTPLDCALIRNLNGLKKILSDSAKLNEQKRLLELQSLYGFKVDYESEVMHAIKSKIKTK